MKLLVNGGSFQIAQMGPDFLLLSETIDVPPVNASIVMQIDQNERRWDVRLPKGASAGSNRVEISPII